MPVLLRDNVYQMLRKAILTCELQPGQELREQILAEKYHVSRSPIRDSLLRLEQENLVTVLPRQGYRVNPISARDVDELFGLRLIIEPACAATAAKVRNHASEVLNEFRNYSKDRTDFAGFLEYNRAFHATVAELAGNRRIASVEIALVEEFDRFVWASLRAFRASAIPSVSRDHDAIIDAIQAGDSDTAFRLSYDHVGEAKTRIASSLHLSKLPEDEPSGHSPSDA